MYKELTVISIFLLGLIADCVWFQITDGFGFIFLLQIGLALFLLTFIVVIGKKYLTRRFYLSPRFSLASALKYFRLGFRPDYKTRQIPLPRV